MRSLYEPLSRRSRAINYRRDARECEAAGFTIFAALNDEMGEMLWPSPKKERVVSPVRAPRERADPSRVGGRHDAPPMGADKAKRERTARQVSRAA